MDFDNLVSRNKPIEEQSAFWKDLAIWAISTYAYMEKISIDTAMEIYKNNRENKDAV